MGTSRLQFIGEEYGKKLEAVLQQYGDDVVKTTEYLDVDIETEPLLLFSLWASANASVAEASGNHVVECFYDGLRAEVQLDCRQSTNEYDRFNLQMAKQVDGRYRVVELKVQHEVVAPLNSRDNILDDKNHSPSESDADTSCFIELPQNCGSRRARSSPFHALTERQPTPNTSSTSLNSSPIRWKH